MNSDNWNIEGIGILNIFKSDEDQYLEDFLNIEVPFEENIENIFDQQQEDIKPLFESRDHVPFPNLKEEIGFNDI